MAKTGEVGAVSVSGKGDIAAGSLRNQLQSRVQRGNHASKIVAAFQNEAGRRNHRIGALLSRQPRILLDPVERIFAGAAVNRKNRFLGGKIDPVIAPFAAGDLAAVEIENFAQFVPVNARRSRGYRVDWSGKAILALESEVRRATIFGRLRALTAVAST
jgi:hypothetical protein